MQPITENLVRELDLLFSLYELAADYASRIQPGEMEEAGKYLEARQKILSRTEISAREVLRLSRLFDEGRNIPLSERALVEERRNMIYDLSLRMQRLDSQILKVMQQKLTEVRKELAGQTERTSAIKAYIKAPQATVFLG